MRKYEQIFHQLFLVIKCFRPPKCNPLINGEPIVVPDEREPIYVREKGGTRKLFVPRRKPVELPILFNKKEYERFQKRAHVCIYLS